MPLKEIKKICENGRFTTVKLCSEVVLVVFFCHELKTQCQVRINVTAPTSLLQYACIDLSLRISNEVLCRSGFT